VCAELLRCSCTLPSRAPHRATLKERTCTRCCCQTQYCACKRSKHTRQLVTCTAGWHKRGCNRRHKQRRAEANARAQAGQGRTGRVPAAMTPWRRGYSRRWCCSTGGPVDVKADLWTWRLTNRLDWGSYKQAIGACDQAGRLCIGPAQQRPTKPASKCTVAMCTM
jgi:hypothetical protein